jgi:hypothetical protein
LFASSSTNFAERGMMGMHLPAHQPLLPLAAILSLSFATAGCLSGKSSIGELLGEEDSSSGAESGSTGAEPGSTGEEPTATTMQEFDDGSDDSSLPGSSSGGAEPALCPADSGCTFAAECGPASGATCGGILGRANDDGCPRPYCSGPGECAAGSSCFLPADWGTCGPHACYDDDAGACECTFGLDCNNDGLCVPDEEGLPPDTNGTEFCGQHTDAGSCDGSGVSELGACRWYEGWQMPLGACEERVPVGRCTFSRASLSDPGPIPSCPGDESLTPLAFIDADLVTVLFVDPEEPPTALDGDLDIDSWGWLPCDQPDAAAECACACT